MVAVAATTTTHRAMLKSVLVTLAILPAILAAELKGSIFFNSILTGPQGLSPSTQVVLNHGQHHTLIRKDGSFIFPDLPEGSYHLAVHSPDYAYTPLFVSLTDTQTHAQYLPPGRLALPTSTTPSLTYPLQLVPSSRLEFFTEPRSLDVLGMLKNPMVLMMIFSAGLMFVMPKMMESMAEMDPEAAKDVERLQAKARSAMNTDWSGHLSGLMPTGEIEAKAGGTATPPTKNSGKKRKGK